MDRYLINVINRWRAFRHTPLTSSEHKVVVDLFANSKGFALTITVCFAIGIYTVWDYVPRLWTATFIFLFVAEAIIKITFAKRFQNSTVAHQRSPKWRLIFVFGSLWSGVVYGIVVLVIFLPVTAEERLLLIGVFFGIIQVVAISSAFFHWTTTWMLIPAIIPTIIGLLIVNTQTTLLLALMLIVSTWSAVLLGKLSAKRYRYISNLNEENERLLINLSRQREIADAEREKAELAVVKNSHFMAVASHDLRQPLHAIGLFHHALKNMDETENPAYLFDSIESSMNVLNSMFDSLLDISQLDAKAILPDIIQIDSDLILRPLVEETRSATSQKNLAFNTSLHNSIIETDPLLLGRIFRNLLGNAIKFTSTGTITLRSSHTGAGLRVDIADTGVGIPKSERSKIFEEFYQGTLDTGRQNGVGLGLSIVDRLCQLLGITLSMEANEPVGIVFSLCIPFATTQPSELVHVPDYVDNDLRQLIIVFIDDDNDIRAAMETVLEQVGCHCLSFADPANALDTLNKEGIVPDLLICDFQLNSPLTGLDCIDLIRKQTGRNLPALLVTGEISGNLSDQSKKAGVPLISKPASPMILMREISNTLRASEQLLPNNACVLKEPECQ